MIYRARAVSTLYTELDALFASTADDGVPAISAGVRALGRKMVSFELLLPASSSSILFWKPHPLTLSLRIATSLFFLVTFL